MTTDQARHTAVSLIEVGGARLTNRNAPCDTQCVQAKRLKVAEWPDAVRDGTFPPHAPVVGNELLMCRARLRFGDYLRLQQTRQMFSHGDVACLLAELLKAREFHYFGIETGKFVAHKTRSRKMLTKYVRRAYRGEPTKGPAVTLLGDVWILGGHRLICADARDHAAYLQLMEGHRAEFVFTDPPYNVPIDGHVSGLGRIRHQDFAMACGEMTQEEFTDFLTIVFARLATHSKDGSVHQICMDWRHLQEMLAAGNIVYSELKNVCVWNKSNGGMGSFYRSKGVTARAERSGLPFVRLPEI